MFILQALDLQNYIVNMTVETEDGEAVRLQDICFQPKTNVCAIESLFQYFQDNKTRLNKCFTILGNDCDNKPSYDEKTFWRPPPSPPIISRSGSGIVSWEKQHNCKQMTSNKGTPIQRKIQLTQTVVKPLLKRRLTGSGRVFPRSRM